MTDLPEPLVSPEVDLAKLDGFMLDTVRLLGSELVALSTGDEFKAAVLLWCRAWKQRPACSLPDDDRVLASFAQVTAAKWKKIRPMALRGFVKCSDGRLYHGVLAADAVRAHKAAEQRREAIRKRWKKENGKATEQPTEPIRPYYGDDTKDGTGRDGTVSKKDSEPIGSAPDDLKAIVFGKGLDWLAKQSGKNRDSLRSLAGKWCRDYGEAAVIEVFGAAQREGPIDPAAWIERALKLRANGKTNGQFRHIPIDQRIRLREAEEKRLGRRMNPAEVADWFAGQGIEPRCE